MIREPLWARISFSLVFSFVICMFLTAIIMIIECELKDRSNLTCDGFIKNVTFADKLITQKSDLEYNVNIGLAHTYTCNVVIENNSDMIDQYHTLYGEYMSSMSVVESIEYLKQLNSSEYNLPPMKAYYQPWELPNTTLVLDFRDLCTSIIYHYAMENVILILTIYLVLVCMTFNVSSCWLEMQDKKVMAGVTNKKIII